MISKERLAEIREAVANPPWPIESPEELESNGWALCRDLLAEHDRLTAEVERLRPLAQHWMALIALPDGARLGRNGYQWEVRDDDHIVQGAGDTPEAALRAAGLMESERGGNG